MFYVSRLPGQSLLTVAAPSDLREFRHDFIFIQGSDVYVNNVLVSQVYSIVLCSLDLDELVA